MTKKTIAAAMLAATLCLVIALPTAYAGGGMGTGSGMTTCRLVLNASQKQPQIVSITDDFVTADVMKVGTLVLLCDLPALGSTVNVPEVPATGSPIPEALRTAVACYAVKGADGARIATTVMDPFTEANVAGGQAHVTLGPIELLCVPAATTNP